MREQLGLAPAGADDATTVDWTLRAPAELEHKRLVPRVTTILNAAVPVFNTDDCDCLDITGLVDPITSMTAGMTGSPLNFQHLMVRIYSTYVLALLWGDAYLDSGQAQLPQVTQAGQTHQIGLEYNTPKGLWICLASDVIGY